MIVNKADDMQLDEESEETDKLMLTGELNEMYEQVEKTIRTEFERKNVLEHLIGIMPLCAIDSYLYRMVKKHGNGFKLSPEQILKIGVNENGKKFSTLKPAIQEKKVYEILTDENFINTMIKLSGFSCLEKTLHKFLNENDTGKTIRVNNLLFDLKKHQDIIQYMNNSTSIFPSNIVSLVEKHNINYQSIRKIDPNLYYEYMTNMVASMFSTLEEKVKLYGYHEIQKLLMDYTCFDISILKVYFYDYCDTSDYTLFLKTHIYNLIVSNNIDSYRIDLTQFISDLDILKHINLYHATPITNLIEIIVTKQTISNNFDDCEIIKMFDSLNELNVKIINLLRFILLNKCKIDITNKNNDLLFSKKMLYQKYNEIPLQNYLSLILSSRVSHDSISESIIINGLDETIEGLKLDLYYLHYISRNNIL